MRPPPPYEMRSVSRAHVIACARTSKSVGSRLPSIQRKLPALSALFDYLCERNAVAGNPVVGVKAARGKWQRRLDRGPGRRPGPRAAGGPPTDTLKGLRDRAILATLLYHGLRREELSRLRVRDIQDRQA